MSDTNTTGGDSASSEVTADSAISDALAEALSSDTSGSDAGSRSPEADRAAAEQASAAQADGQQSTQTSETPAAEADQAAPAPDGWSAEDQAALDALPPQAKALMQKRIGALEAEHTRKTQATSEAVKLAEGVSAIVDDELRGRMQRSGMDLVQGVKYLADLERFASSRPADYLRFVANHVRELGLDPVKELGLSGGQGDGTGAEPFVDPRYDKLEGELRQMRDNLSQTEQRRSTDAARREIEAFKTAKGEDGNPLRPHFDEVQQHMAILVRADRNMTLDQAYDAAVWSNPTVRAKVQEAERKAAEAKSRQEGAEAARGARQNIRPGGRSMERNAKVENVDDAVSAALAEVIR